MSLGINLGIIIIGTSECNTVMYIRMYISNVIKDPINILFKTYLKF